jgi:hypothetical protein
MYKDSFSGQNCHLLLSDNALAREETLNHDYEEPFFKPASEEEIEPPRAVEDVNPCDRGEQGVSVHGNTAGLVHADPVWPIAKPHNSSCACD